MKPNGKILFGLIWFSLANQLPNVICFDLVPNVRISFGPIWFGLDVQLLNAICFGLVPNVLIQFVPICFGLIGQLPNSICFGLVPNQMRPNDIWFYLVPNEHYTAQWGSSLLGPHTLDPLLSPSLTSIKVFCKRFYKDTYENLLHLLKLMSNVSER